MDLIPHHFGCSYRRFQGCHLVCANELMAHSNVLAVLRFVQEAACQCVFGTLSVAMLLNATVLKCWVSRPCLCLRLTLNCRIGMGPFIFVITVDVEVSIGMGLLVVAFTVDVESSNRYGSSYHQFCVPEAR